MNLKISLTEQERAQMSVNSMSVDAENAFNSINRKVMLHNLKFICPIIATYIINCYTTPLRLFVVAGREILSSEGTTQGDQTHHMQYAFYH